MTTLGSLLVQNRIVGVIDIEKALQRQVIMGGDLATNLLELGLVDENILTKYAAKSFGMPILERTLLEVPDEGVVKMMPWAAANEHKIVPVRIEGDKMILAVSSPLPENALAEVGFLLGVEFAPRFVLEFRLAVALHRCFGIPMSKRFIALKNRLAPELALDLPPLVPQPSRAGGLMSAANVHPKDSAQPTMPADPDYMHMVTKTAEASQSPGSAVAEMPSLSSAGVSDTSFPLGDAKTAARVSKSAADASKQKARLSITPPLDTESIKEKLLQAAHRDEILDIFMEAANSVFEFAVLFVIHGTDAVAHSMTDEEGRIRRTSVPVVPTDIGGMFQTAFSTGSFYLGPPGKTTEDELVLQEMNRRRPKNCAILPVLLRGRILMMLYGDCGALGVKAEKMSELTQLTRLVAEAFERLLLEKKYGKYRAVSSRLPSKPAHMAFSQIPDREDTDLDRSAGLYRIVNSDPSGKLRPDATSDSDSDANADTESSVLSSGAADQDTTDETPLGKDSGGTADSDSNNIPTAVPMASVSLSPRAAKPPAQLALDDDTEEEKALKKAVMTGEGPRSVVVNMKEEIDRLVTRILESTKRFDQAALDVLLGMGDNAIAKLVAHFPGPLVCDRYQESDKLQRVDRHGPLLKALIAFGKAAISHILPLLESRDSDVRFYATFLFTEMKYPEALDGLTSRLFDNDRHIRGIAVDVIRGFAGYPEYRWSIGQVLETLESPSRDLDAKRIAASVLGDLGEQSGVESLINMLDSVDETLVRASRRALVKITFFDHGFTRKRWSDWYSIYRNKTRIEWAMEGLGNEDEAIRRSAWSYLLPCVKDAVETGLAEPSTYRDYKEIQERLKRWWREEGRDLHRITTGS